MFTFAILLVYMTLYIVNEIEQVELITRQEGMLIGMTSGPTMFGLVKFLVLINCIGSFLHNINFGFLPEEVGF